jgi:hypothetical protein
MNLYGCAMDCAAPVGQWGSVRQRSSVRQYEQQFMAVRTVVCAQCAAVRLVVVYGSARSSVRLSVSVAVCGSVQQCAAVCGRVRQWAQ